MAFSDVLGFCYSKCTCLIILVYHTCGDWRAGWQDLDYDQPMLQLHYRAVNIVESVPLHSLHADLFSMSFLFLTDAFFLWLSSILQLAFASALLYFSLKLSTDKDISSFFSDSMQLMNNFA